MRGPGQPCLFHNTLVIVSMFVIFFSNFVKHPSKLIMGQVVFVNSNGHGVGSKFSGLVWFGFSINGLVSVWFRFG